MASLSLGAVLRQYDLDLEPAPPAPQSAIPPRLLILACSSSKAAGDGLSARDRYTGPLWQSLKTADPAGEACFTAALSARYGLIDAKTPIADYNQVLDAQPYAAALQNCELVALAQSTTWRGPVTQRPWRLPAGAFAEAAGPS